MLKSIALLFLAVSSPAAQPPKVIETLISNVTIVDVINGRLLPKQHILIRGEKIAAISPSPFPTAVQRTIDGTHLVALPGFVNTHTHLWQHVAKSVAPSGTLQEWIPRVYGVADYLSDAELYDVTLAAASQGLLSGITTVVDFSSVNFASSSLPTTIRAVRDAGVDGVVIWWDSPAFMPPQLKEKELRRLSERDPEHLQVWIGPGPLSFFPIPAVHSAILLAKVTGTRLAEHTMENLQEQRDFAESTKKYLASYQGRIAPELAVVLANAIPAAPLPAVDGVYALRRKARDLLDADDAKSSDDIPDTEERMLNEADRAILRSLGTTQQPSPLLVLNQLGALPGFLSIHSVWVDRRDMELLKRNGASVSLNPESNMYLSSGAPPLLEYLHRGINVTVGTDGAASNDGMDFFSAMRATWNLQKADALDTEVTRAISAWDVLRMATINGAKAIGRDSQTGSIDVGKEADLVLLSMDSFGMAPFRDTTAVALIVNSAGVRDVGYVFSNGNLVVQNGRLALFDEAQLSRHLSQSAKAAFERSTTGKQWKETVEVSSNKPDQFLYRTLRKQDTVDVQVINSGPSAVSIRLAFSGTEYGGTAAPMLRPEALQSTPLDAPESYYERAIKLRVNQSLTLTKEADETRYTIRWPSGESVRDMPEREQVFIGIAGGGVSSR